MKHDEIWKTICIDFGPTVTQIGDTKLDYSGTSERSSTVAKRWCPSWNQLASFNVGEGTRRFDTLEKSIFISDVDFA